MNFRRFLLAGIASFLCATAQAQVIIPPSGGSSVTSANPSAQVGTSAVNGNATTFMTSDSAPALNQAMSPNALTGQWQWTPAANQATAPLTDNACTATGSGAPLCGLNITAFNFNTTGNPDGWILHASGTLTACAGNCYEIDIPGFNLNQNGTAGFSGTVTSQANLNAVGALQLNGATICSSTAPTISSGFGTSPSVASNNGNCSFEINVGTGGTATSGVVAMNITAPHHFSCWIQDTTTASASVFLTKQTASTTTTVTFGNFNTSGVATAWAASDILNGGCTVH